MHEFVHELVLQSTAFLSSFLLLLVVAVFAEKILRNTFQRYRRRRYHFYEEKLLAQFAEEPPRLHLGPFKSKHRRDFRIIEQLLLDYACQFRGSIRKEFTYLFEALGYVAYEVQQLKAWRWWVRAQAAKRLGEMGSPQATIALQTALADRNEEVWFMAAKALTQIDNKRAAQPVYQSLSQRLHFGNVSYVFEVVMQLDSEGLASLLATFPRYNTAMQTAVVRALGELKNPQATPFLLPLLADGQHHLAKVDIITALGRLGDPRAIQPLRDLLTNASAEIRQSAVQALGRLQAIEVADAIRSLLDDPDYWVSFRAGEALAAMGELGRKNLHQTLTSRSAQASTMAKYFLAKMA